MMNSWVVVYLLRHDCYTFKRDTVSVGFVEHRNPQTITDERPFGRHTTRRELPIKREWGA